MEVITADRPGLLARVGWALANCHVSLLNAKIATFGEKVEDFFFVSDRDDKAIEDPAQLEALRQSLQKHLESPEQP